MAGEDVGRSLRLYWGGELVATVQEKSVKFNGEPVEKTNDDSAGWREYIDKAGVNSVDFEFSGVTSTDALRADWFDGVDDENKRMKAAELRYPDGGIISGTFYLSEYSETGKHDEAITFEGSFMSSGAVAYTRAGA